MKKIAVFSIALAVALCLSPAAHAQEHEYLVGIKLGGAMPTNDFGEGFDTAFLFGISGEVAFTPSFALEASLVRHSHNESDEGAEGLFPIHLQMSLFSGIEEEHFGGEKSLTMNEATLNAKWYLARGSVQPYFTGGAGIYFWTFNIENLGDATESDFGVNVGAGLLFPMGHRLYAGIDGRYNHVWTQIAADEQKLTWWNLTGSLSYGF